MVGVTLLEIREHVEALAENDGRYVVVCGRSGGRPIPVAGLRFPDRATARGAALAAEQYRSALRRYDPAVPFYDLIACEDTGPLTDVGGNGDPVATPDGTGPGGGDVDDDARGSGGAWALSDPVLDGSRPGPAWRDRVEFCHRVAGAVFETLSEAGYDDVETAVMDAYFDLAERLSDPDDLCLCLLESTAAELDDRLDPRDQATVLSGAGARLAPPPVTAEPVAASFARLRRVGLVEDVSCSRGSTDRAGGPRTVLADLSAYALSPTDGRLPVLPVVVDLFRRRLDRPPSAARARETADGWTLALAFGTDAEPGHLASAPIRWRR